MELPDGLKKYVDSLSRIGFARERKALALLCLGFYASQLLLSGALAIGAAPEVAPLLLALGGYYAIGFFAVGADWFWGRWFAGGIGAFGVSMGAWGLLQARELNPILLFILVTHGVIALCLMGERMAALYDAQEPWRKRFGVDEQGVVRVRRSVQRAATTLPVIIMMALTPRAPGDDSLASFAALGLAGLSLFGLLRGRTFGLLAAAAAAAAVLVVPAASLTVAASPLQATPASLAPLVAAPAVHAAVALLLLAAVAPFATPIARWLSARD